MAPGGQDPERWIDAEHFHRVFVGDTTPERTHLMTLTQRPLAMAVATGAGPRAGVPPVRDVWHAAPPGGRDEAGGASLRGGAPWTG